MKRYATTLIIAGSDSCGGAGIQADIKTCTAIGVYAATAITALTAQNTYGVRDIQPATPQMVRNQIEAVLEDLTVDCIKIGMLCNTEIAQSVAETLQGVDIPIILDPVMISTSGHKLLSDEAIEVIMQRLFPLTQLITPNIHEAELLAGMEIKSSEDITEAAHKIMQRGCKAVLIKGGHLEGSKATDRLFTTDSEVRVYASDFIDTPNTHGTGCTLASAIAAHRALGYDIPTAIEKAKKYVAQAIAQGADVFAGKGHGPLNHAYDPQPLQIIETK